MERYKKKFKEDKQTLKEKTISIVLDADVAEWLYNVMGGREFRNKHNAELVQKAIYHSK